MAAAPPTVFCDVHAAAVAGWRCTVCARNLCAACTASNVQGIAVCCACGHGVEAVLVPRAVVFPFAKTWPSELAALLTLRGVLQVLVAALALQFFLAFGPRWWTLGRVLELGWILFLARRVGVGFDPFGLPRYGDLGSVWVGPLPRFLAGAGPVLLAAARGAGFGREAVPAGTGWVWLVVLLAIAVVPPSLVAACVEGEGTAPAWPWRLPALLRGLGRDLTPLMVATAAAALFEVVDGAMEPFSGEDTKLDLHIVQAFLPRWASLEALAGLAILAGALVRTRATELGHGDPAADLVARLQEPPAGRWTPPAPDPEVVAAEQARRYAPIELADPRDVIREAVARKDVDAALVPLKGGHVAPDAVDADVLIELAQLMGGRGQFAEAAQVLRGVAVRPRGPQTARALVILARLCVERLGDVDEGRALYRRVVADFPGTPAAEFARAQLAADGE
jgi:hypothetical protein